MFTIIHHHNRRARARVLPHSLQPKPLYWLLVALLGLVLSACGGSGSSSNLAASAATGTVGIVLTDAPTDDFSAINMTVLSVQLLSEEHAPVTVFEGEETINLLALRDHAQLFAMANVPAGDYNKIRLILKQPDGLELVLASGDKQYPRLPGNGKIDLNPHGTIRVLDGQLLYAHIDLDAEKSIHVVTTGNGKYQFRPVVFVDILDDAFAGKLVRRSGYVQALAADLSAFKLCDQEMPMPPVTQPLPPVEEPVPLSGDDSSMDHADLMGCMYVYTQNATLFAEDGLPLPLEGLSEGSHLRVIGFLRRTDDDDKDTELEIDDHVMEFAKLSAEVIETLDDMGNVETVDGTVASAPTDAMGSFDLALADGSTLTSLLQEGTKVFGRDGSRLDFSAIQPDILARVDGVRYLDGMSEVLRSSLVVLDTADTTGLAKLSGTVNTTNPEMHSVNIATGSGDQELQLTADTVILVVDTSGGSATSTAGDISALTTGASVEVYGRASALGYFVAQVVLVLN